jgi:hypothetical protein
MPVTNVTPETASPESLLSLVTIGPCRGSASQLDRVGGPNALPASNVSIPLGCVQAEGNQFHGTTREKIGVTLFEHGVVQLFWR